MADQTPPSARPSRLWRTILVLSLALNLAVAGLFVGAATSGRWKGGPPPKFEVGFGPIGRALAHDEKRDIRRGLIRDQVLRDLNLRAGMTDIVTVLQTTPFDEDRLRALLDTQRERTQGLQIFIQDGLMDVIREMTPERRAEFAEQVTDEITRIDRDRDRSPNAPEDPSGG